MHAAEAVPSSARGPHMREQLLAEFEPTVEPRHANAAQALLCRLVRGRSIGPTYKKALRDAAGLRSPRATPTRSRRFSATPRSEYRRTYSARLQAPQAGRESF